MTAHEGDESRPADEEGDLPETHDPAGQDPAHAEPAHSETDDPAPEAEFYWTDDGTGTSWGTPANEFPQIQHAAEPGRGKLFLYSVTAHGLVMAIVSLLVWWLTHRAGITIVVPAVVGTIATLLFLLRLYRGSVLDAEAKVRERLTEQYIVEVNDRIANVLYPDENVRWLERQHPLSIISVGFTRLLRTKRRRRITFWYVIALVVAVGVSRWYASQGDPAGFVPTINGLIGLLLLVIPGYLTYVIQEWRLNRYAITTMRLVGVVGVFVKSQGSMPNARFTDVKVTTSATANVLAWLRIIDVAYATWDVESAGQEQALKYLFFVREGYIVAAVFGLGKI